MDLEGKKALITGSRRGIGRGTAVALARAGCDIGLNDVERDPEADRTIQMVEQTGRRATFSVADIGLADEVERLFAEFLDAHGRIDILVNNAYWAQNLPFLEITEAVWDRTMDVCLLRQDGEVGLHRQMQASPDALLKASAPSRNAETPCSHR